MKKVKIILAYDGSRFNGFQIQKGRVETVSKRIYEAFKSVGIFEKFNASGRTDKGVHATFQVLDVKVPDFWIDKLDILKIELNRKLNPSVNIRDISLVDEDFHSRFSAKRRVYRYIVSFEEFSPFASFYVTFVKDLDEKKIKDAIRVFEGVHDFDYFKKSKGGTENFVREIFKARYYRYKEYGVFYFEANGFLRSQIRMMVGFLLKISDGKLTKQQLERQLDCQEVYSRYLADPCGLYLSKVKF